MRLQINQISSKYAVKELTETDIDEIYELELGNPLYYRYGPPAVTRESVLKEMKALPPKKTYEDKYYIGFWDKEKLIAIMDLIVEYPNEDTAFIGLFMLEKSVQGNGVGTDIIAEFSSYMKSIGYSFVRLGYVKGNPQSKAFWLKNSFEETGVVCHNEEYDIIVLEKILIHK
ncbi:MAG: GNAT family N-acetyltransferase [Lachnospiraceae bacterium]|nr:GNAT family N-acetyltransferase [Lachnospiraceae bacterium]